MSIHPSRPSPRRLRRRLFAAWLPITVLVIPTSAAGAATAPSGVAYAWGANAFGELGHAPLADSTTPVPVSGLPSGVLHVIAAARHSFAILADGSVKAWGRGTEGELGNGKAANSTTPVGVSGFGPGSGVAAVAGNAPPISTTNPSGDGHSMALKTNGAVYGWGHDNSGQVGNGIALPVAPGTNVNVLSPVQVVGLGAGSGVIAISAGGSHSLALKSDGTVLAWGNNQSGQLGDGAALPGADHSSPVTVSGMGPGSGVVQVAAGNAFSVARKSDGTVWTWGNNASGQLGDGTTTDRSTPGKVSGLSNVREVEAGDAFAIAVKNDGSVWAWGNNASGEIGNGNAPTDQHTPAQVKGLGAGSGVTTVRAAFSHVVALRFDGTMLAWGRNTSGQLGDGTTTQRNAPEVLRGMNRVAEISAGGSHTLISRAPLVSITPASGHAGTHVTVTGTRFRPGEKVNVVYKTRLSAPSQVVLCSATANSKRTFTCGGVIPAKSGPPGTHSIVATGATSQLRASTTFKRT